ncbi:MAG: aminodeoxychorismate lyase [Marinobacterium sp.]|nr:aminodeoxychorismate lyase [Marinobacterium sp.]
MTTWLNGQQVAFSEAVIGLSDRGLSYGDGLFETIQVRDGRALLLDAHWSRLQSGLQRLKFPEDTLLQVQQDLLAVTLPESGVLKIVVTRGPGGRGYRLPSPVAASRIITLAELPVFACDPASHGIHARLCETQLGINPVLAGLKHLNRLEQVLARSEWDQPDIAEGLVCDLDGYLVEGTMSNLFWVCNGVLHTPLLNRNGVEGVVRNHLIALAGRSGFRVEKGYYRAEVLLHAQEAFICNSLIDVWPIVRLDDQVFSIGAVTRQLQQQLQQEYQL